MQMSEWPIPLSPKLIALGIRANRVSCFVIFVFSSKNVKIFWDDCLWKLWSSLHRLLSAWHHDLRGVSQVSHVSSGDLLPASTMLQVQYTAAAEGIREW